MKDAKEEDDWGVMPDEGYEVVVEGEDLTQLRLWRFRRDGYRSPRADDPPQAEDERSIDNDKQLLRAVEYIEGQLSDEVVHHTS